MASRISPLRPTLLTPGAGSYTAYAVRGPDETGRFYWTVKWWTDSPTGRTRTSTPIGWHHRPAAEREVIALAGAESPESYAASGEVRTVRDLMETWLAVVQGSSKKPATKNTIRWVAKRIVREMGADRLDRVSVDSLDAYVARRLDEQNAPKSSIRLELVYLGAAWSWGYERGFTSTPKLTKPSIRDTAPVYHDRTPEPVEVVQVQAELDLRAAEKPSQEVWAMAHRLLWCTGCRPHEIDRDHLLWHHLDLEDGVLTVPNDTKTGTREVPLSVDMVSRLRQWREKCGHVGDDEPVLNIRNISPGLNWRLGGQKGRQGICGRLGIERYTAKGLRKLAVDQLYDAAWESRADVATVAAIMGHSPATAIKHYRTPSARNKRAAVAAAGLGTVPADQPAVIEFPGQAAK